MTAGIKDLNPYPGPRPFEPEEQRLFFGREREVRELRSLITAHRAVLLYAQSGAGKTSLLNAGLIPLLTKQGFEVLPVARVRGFEPEDIDLKEIPNIYVFNTLVGWAGDNVEPRSLVSTSIVTFLEEGEHLVDEEGLPLPRVAIFDQFEELFTSYPGRWKEREDFCRQVAEALKADPLLRVLFVIREDYLASLDSYVDLLPERLRTRYRLGRLRADAACRAVEGPLRDIECSFAEGVASKLVKQLLNIRIESASGEMVEAPGEYVEPVQLQIACQSLWLNLPRRITVITSDHLHEFGDVEESLKGFYESAIETAEQETGVNKGDLRRWFNDEPITSAGTRGTVFRDQEMTGGMPNSAVDVLEARHIIRAEMRAGARWYELTHDRLIEPIRKSNESWEEGQRADEQQQQIETERHRAEEQQRRARRFRRLTAALAVTFVLATAFGIYAFWQRKRAEQQRTVAKQESGRAKEAQKEAEEQKIIAEDQKMRAEAGRLAACAGEAYSANQFERSVLLALESLERKGSLEGYQALHRGLALLPRSIRLLRHEAGLRSVAVSPDGKYLATASEDNAAYVWEVLSGKKVAQMDHGNDVTAVAFSPDGKYVATASWDNTARVWEALSGKKVAQMGHQASVTAVAFSPDGKYLATASDDKTARVWEWASKGSNKEVARMSHRGHVRSVSFSPDGKYLATASQDNTVHLWEWRTKKEVSRASQNDRVTALAFSPDGR